MQEAWKVKLSVKGVGYQEPRYGGLVGEPGFHPSTAERKQKQTKTLQRRWGLGGVALYVVHVNLGLAGVP